MAVDIAYLEFWQQKQQTATDAAALGGAEQLGHGNCSSPSPAETAAALDANLDGFSSAGQTSVSAVTPPSSGPYANNACAISVKITTQNVPTFFSRLIFPQAMSETTQAVAVASATGTGCIYLLSTTIDQNFNGANVKSQCGVLINDTANFNGSTFNVPYIGYAGAAPNLNGSNFTNATPAPMLAVADPCSEIPGCAYLTANPPPTSSCTSFNGNGYNGGLQAQCFSSLNLNGATVTLAAGTYTLTGSSNFNGAHITGSGVTIYVTSTATPPNFNGANVSLSPPTSGNENGVLYYQVPANTGSPNFNGTTQGYSGLLYAPSAPSVNFNGAAGGYVVLVFGGVNFNGSNAQDFATPPPGQSLITQAVITE